MNIKNLDQATVNAIIPDRDPDAHKGCFGKILLLCGSVGYTGAAALAAMGALRSGAGLVYLGVPESIYTIEAIKLTEAIVFPMKDQKGQFAEAAADEALTASVGKDAVLIGPGIGCSDGTYRIVETVLRQYTGTAILDADGINVLNGHMNLLRERTAATILTPHLGEFSRIIGGVVSDPMASAVQFAKQMGVVLLLKGHRTIITDGTTTYVNMTGNPGMAVGGSGDLLAGIITSLVGQGLRPLEAAACGAYIHGAAGDICADEIGQTGMLPSDMLNVLPRLLK